MEIRLLELKDVQQCVGIVGLNYDKQYDRVKIELEAMFDNNAWIKPEYWVVEVDDKIVSFGGYCESCIDYNCFGMYWINTHPEFKNKGYASMVIKAIIESVSNRTKENKDSWIILSCKEHLKDFYSNFGFKVLMNRPKKGGYMMGMSIFESKI